MGRVGIPDPRKRGFGPRPLMLLRSSLYIVPFFFLWLVLLFIFVCFLVFDHPVPLSACEFFWHLPYAPALCVLLCCRTRGARRSSPIDATVKWFNAEKGFVRRRVSDERRFFLHIASAKRPARNRAAGAKLQVHVAQAIRASNNPP